MSFLATLQDPPVKNEGGFLEELVSFLLGSKYSAFGGKIKDQVMGSRGMNIPPLMDRVQKGIGKLAEGGNADMMDVLTGYPKQDWAMANAIGSSGAIMPGGTPMMKQIDVYHGSPHKFDKFKMSQIGTGEGAQAFGHGLYFTDKAGIARSYAKTIKDQQALSAIRKKYDQRISVLRSDLIDLKGTESATLSKEQIPIYNKKFNEYQDLRQRRDKELDALEDLGSVYKATLHKGKDPSEYDYLDWDKPVSKELREKLDNVADEIPIFKSPYGHGSSPDQFREWLQPHMQMTGNDIYRQLSDAFGSQEKASQFLKRAGIDGIRYPAGTLSGGNKDDAKNYVVFDEDAITIENEN